MPETEPSATFVEGPFWDVSNDEPGTGERPLSIVRSPKAARSDAAPIRPLVPSEPNFRIRPFQAFGQIAANDHFVDDRLRTRMASIGHKAAATGKTALDRLGAASGKHQLTIIGQRGRSYQLWHMATCELPQSIVKHAMMVEISSLGASQ